MGSYRERLFVPVSYWVLAVPVAILLGGEGYFFANGLIPLLIIGFIFAVFAVFLVHWGTATLEVDGGVLRAGRDTLALSETSQAVALDERQSRLLRGPRADPAAYILLRPYLKRAVFVGLTEPIDGVPYWLLATRRPDELAAAIERARQADDRESVG